MSWFVTGFADELTKLAGPPTANLIERLRRSPELRKAIVRSTLLGAGTGAVTGAFTHDKDSGRAKKVLTGAALGALGGGITGAVYPGWFDRRSRLASDEHGGGARIGLGRALSLGSLGHAAYKALG